MGWDDNYLKASITEKNLNLDPAGDWMTYHIDVFNLLFDTLYLIDSEANIQPSLASALPEISLDGKIVRIPIRQDARFHDDRCFPEGKGRAVTASDFIYSIKRIADPKNETGLWSLLSGRIVGLDEYRKAMENKTGRWDDEIAGLRAEGDLWIRIELVRPFSQLLSILSMPSFSVVPPEAVKKYSDEFKHHPIGSGPFRLQSYGPKEIILKRRPLHWRNPDSPKGKLPEGIIFKYYDDSWNAFKTGSLDIVVLESKRLHSYLDDQYRLKEEPKKGGYGVLLVQDASQSFLIFNHDDPLMQNIHLRQAIAYALPWRDLIDEEDHYSASLIPQSIPGFTDLKYELDPERAKKELDLAGFPGGKGLPELVLRIKWPLYIRRAAMMEDALEVVGLRIRLEQKEEDELQGVHLGLQSWTMDYPDALSILTIFSSQSIPPNGNNYGHFRSSPYDAMLETTSQVSGSERVALYEQMARWFHEQAVAIPFRFFSYYYALSPRILSIDTDRLGYFRWTNVQMKPPSEVVQETSP